MFSPTCIQFELSPFILVFWCLRYILFVCYFFSTLKLLQQSIWKQWSWHFWNYATKTVIRKKLNLVTNQEVWNIKCCISEIENWCQVWWSYENWTLHWLSFSPLHTCNGLFQSLVWVELRGLQGLRGSDFIMIIWELNFTFLVLITIFQSFSFSIFESHFEYWRVWNVSCCLNNIVNNQEVSKFLFGYWRCL